MKEPVVIGSRYIRDHRKVEDRDSGRYEEVNPVIEGHAALIQMALLAKAGTNKTLPERLSK